MQSRTRRALVALLLLAGVALTPAAPARADSHESAPPQPTSEASGEADHDPGWVKKGWDLVFMRPFDLVGLGFGGVFWVIAYPVSLVAGGSTDVQEACITHPFERTFQRPLGRL